MQSLRILPHTQKERVHVHEMPNVGVLGGVRVLLRKGPGGSAASQNDGQAVEVQMADVQDDKQAQDERVAHQVALQRGPAERGQLTQIDIATPRAGQAELQGNTEAPDPIAVSSWTEERWRRVPSGTTRGGLRQRTYALLKKLLQHHTNCHHQRVKRRDSESLEAELAAARWTWLGPTMLVRAYDGGELTRWTPVTSVRLYRFSRLTHAHRQTYKLPLRSTRKKTAVTFSLPPTKLVKRMARCVVLTQTSRPSDAPRGDHPCCVNG